MGNLFNYKKAATVIPRSLFVMGSSGRHGDLYRFAPFLHLVRRTY
ncbi:hypothetical protein [Paenibacillus mendelii]|uniref:Uncharacterized protein n=1 Tax=Paenibacillus mendelii TaxID=206163 RepID=A0ABV6JD49_9BACL|nr:hypothetical protein [Paenibacillus mendelii]MCQ6562413.1 hypothetical protein [Paenibacillus mendelii]